MKVRPGMLKLMTVGLCAALLAFALHTEAAPPLPALNIDVAQTSVSGISSGGFMSVQFQVAHSSIVKGAGIVAGGPYYCSRDDVVTAVAKCSCTGEPTVPCKVTDSSADVAGLVAATRANHTQGRIDAPENLARQRVMTISGALDTLVPPPIARQLTDYYTQAGVPTQNLSAIQLPNAAHTMPTPDYGVACGKETEPYIGKCGFDSAKEILTWIYGPLTLPPAGDPKGKFIQFDQTEHVPASIGFSYLWRNGMDSTGWVYVPDACAKGEQCRVHIALHGCKQGQSYLPLKPPPGGGLYNGTTFVKNTGYDRWADNNHIVVLFPQAVSIPYLNPNGCWDWWGYTGDDYATRDGVQIRALRAMVDALAAGRRP